MEPLACAAYGIRNCPVELGDALLEHASGEVVRNCVTYENG